MSIKQLRDMSRKVRDAAGRAYIEQQASKRNRMIARETDDEVREALAMERSGWLNAESAS